MWEQVAIVEDLLRRNRRLASDLDSNNSSPLHIAAAEGNFEITSMLLRVAPEMCWSLDGQGMNPIHIAAKNGHVEVLEHVLGVNPSPAMERLNCGGTVLHLCVKHGQFRTFKVLVEKLGDLVHAKDEDEETLLHWAVRCNQLEIVYMLPVAPEMCWSLNGQGMNPIHIAAKNGHLEVLEHLLDVNPSPAMEELSRGQTVLHLCVKHGQFMTFKVLVEKLGDLVHAKDEDGETLLHWAVRCYQLEMVQYLIENTNIFATANNSMEYSPMGILEEMPRNETTVKIKKVLERSEINFAYTLNPNSRARDAVIVVLALIATVAFQAIVSNPGGVWQDDSSTHKAGEAVMA